MARRMMLNETSYHGYGAINEIITEMKARDFKKAFVCTDNDLIKFKVSTKVTDLLDKENIPYVIFSDVKQNPTIENVKEGVEVFKKSDADCIIAIGGGSAMDTAKAIGIIITNPEFSDVRSLEGLTPSKNKSVPIIAVATTAGTASEVTINYVITDVQNKRKFVCVDPHDIPVVAIVDPDMMSTMPKSLKIATGMDALTHAIEGYITKGAFEMSDMVHLKSIELIANNLREAANGDKKALENMALAQYIAGMGYSNVGLGIVHSLAHGLGALYDMPHGIANAVLLPTVMDFNKTHTGEKYKDIARAFGVKDTDKMTMEEYRDAAVNAVRKLTRDLEINESLKDVIKNEEELEFLAKSAFDDVCRGGNPKDTSLDDLRAIYQSLM